MKRNLMLAAVLSALISGVFYFSSDAANSEDTPGRPAWIDESGALVAGKLPANILVYGQNGAVPCDIEGRVVTIPRELYLARLRPENSPKTGAPESRRVEVDVDGIKTEYVESSFVPVLERFPEIATKVASWSRVDAATASRATSDQDARCL